jgi:enediyne polyketide synthase
LGEKIAIQRRPDGKPEVMDGRVVSIAHTAELTLAVAGPKENGSVGCDMEPVEVRSEAVWQDLLGLERFKLVDVIARTAHEDQDTAATRVWAAGECLKKAGAALDTALTLASASPDGWVLLSAGAMVTATYAAQIQSGPNPLVLAVLVKG